MKILVLSLSAVCLATSPAQAQVKILLDFDHDNDPSTIQSESPARADDVTIRLRIEPGFTIPAGDFWLSPSMGRCCTEDPPDSECFGAIFGQRFECNENVVTNCDIELPTLERRYFALNLSFRESIGSDELQTVEIGTLQISSPRSDLPWTCDEGPPFRFQISHLFHDGEDQNSNVVYLGSPVNPVLETTWGQIKEGYRSAPTP